MVAKIFLGIVIMSLVMAVPVDLSRADSSSRDILRQGLLGAGSGAVGGAASGAKGRDVWKGALAGAGVNIVGGALLDSLSGERVSSTQRVDSVPPRDAYSQGYEDGYQNGYKAGYTQGYRDGLREGFRDR